jgi:UDP-N-acetyl-D-galactosamine dehydrogenase
MKEIKVAIIGLGYVGLPLAVEFAKKYKVIGFDIDTHRISELKKGKDTTLEVDAILLNKLLSSGNLFLSTNPDELKDSNFYIITVPTPIDAQKKPNLRPLFSASKMVGRVLKKNDIVVYESTVFPGATEEECVPILEQKSGLVYNSDFFVGYSPERINPGDKERTVANILKVTSGSTPEIADKIDAIYASIIVAGTYKAPSIKVAEAAKVIENAQRDINIAFVNELSKIFRLMDIDTNEVLEAAGTKWNFLPFKPGLVGGHCIGVDPYYLAQKAISLGYNPEIILSGRRLNDSMGKFVVVETIKMMVKKGISVNKANVLVLGIAFKENCPDIRNSKAIDIINELESYEINVDVYDPWATVSAVKHEYDLDLLSSLDEVNIKYQAIIIAVAHDEFRKLNLEKYLDNPHVIFDVKAMLPKEKSHIRL